MTIHDDETRRLGPPPPGRRSWPSWLVAGLPLLAIPVVVAVGLFGRAAPAPASPPPAAAVVTSPSSPSVAVQTAAPTSTPGRSPAIAQACVAEQVTFNPDAPPDLTGLWEADDAGIYYVRQIGTTIWWNGMSDRRGPPASLGRDWNNVGRGELKRDFTIVSEWADVPRGQILGGGTVVFQVGADAEGNVQITKLSETGTGRGDTRWTPCAGP